MPGGGLCTEEWPVGSGFLHNTHSFYHRGVDPDAVVCRTRTRAARCPLPRTRSKRGHAAPGRALPNLVGRTSSAPPTPSPQFSRRDADTLRRWREAFLPIVTQILEPEAQAPPLPAPERQRHLATTAEGRLLLETSACSPREFVLREFENPAVQAGLLFFNGLREVDPRAPGFGHHIPALLAARGQGADVRRRLGPG